MRALPVARMGDVLPAAQKWLRVAPSGPMALTDPVALGHASVSKGWQLGARVLRIKRKPGQARRARIWSNDCVTVAQLVLRDGDENIINRGHTRPLAP